MASTAPLHAPDDIHETVRQNRIGAQSGVGRGIFPARGAAGGKFFLRLRNRPINSLYSHRQDFFFFLVDCSPSSDSLSINA